jgi:hypothetical protein
MKRPIIAQMRQKETSELERDMRRRRDVVARAGDRIQRELLSRLPAAGRPAIQDRLGR